MRSLRYGVDVARRLVLTSAILAAFAGQLAGQLTAADALPILESPPPPDTPSRWIVVHLSADLFRPLVEQPIDENLAVEEEILGVQATGQARVQGQPKLVIDEDNQAAAFQIELSGTIHSQTVGRKGPATLYGHSDARFTATKRVIFDPDRGFVGQPSQATVQTEVVTDRIEARRRGLLGRVVERAAWSRVADSSDQVQAIVKERTERRIRAEFDRILDQRLVRVNRVATWRHAVLWALGSSGQPRYACRTCPHGLQIAVALLDSELAQPGPDIDWAANVDRSRQVQVWMHEETVSERLSLGLRWLELGRRWIGGTGMKTPSVEFATRREWLVLQFGSVQTDDAASAVLAANR